MHAIADPAVSITQVKSFCAEFMTDPNCSYLLAGDLNQTPEEAAGGAAKTNLCVSYLNNKNVFLYYYHSGKPTHFGPRGAKELDAFIMSKNIADKVTKIENIAVDRGESDYKSTTSDHNPIYLDFSLDL